MTSTPTLDQFIGEIDRLIGARDADKLKDFLVVEPPYSQLYNKMIAEIKKAFHRSTEDALESKCIVMLSQAREGEWNAFPKFLVSYLDFICHVSIDNLLETYNMLSELVQKCNSALVAPFTGYLLLPTVISYSRLLSKLAIGLDKQPSLIAHLVKRSEEGRSETLPERAANIIRQAFVTCLNDKTVTIVSGKRPEGKQSGVYRLANMCLKILYSCRKTSNAEQIFVNIYNQAPPLALYPKAEQVTYLYYLGRFEYSNSHFYRSHSTLHHAYSLCHPHFVKQRRIILIQLLASNMILGLFPTPSLFQRPEAKGLDTIFGPICQAIAKGDLATFRKLLDWDSPLADWLLHFRILLQIRNRCEVLVWRSLARKTFLLKGNDPGDGRKAPTLDLQDFLVVFQYLDRRARAIPGTEEVPVHVHPEFEGVEWPEGKKPKPLIPDMLEVESIFSSLIVQGLLGGFISHKQLRFAIQGAKYKGALAAGFPSAWGVIASRDPEEDKEIPGWKREVKQTAPGAANGSRPQVGPGVVINLRGARPVGASPG